MRMQAGYSLIEVLIALLVLTISLLGIAGMQLLAMRDTESAFNHAVAGVQASNLLERYQLGSSSSALSAWNQHNAALLPAGQGQVSCGGAVCTVNVSWGEAGAQHVSLTGPS